MNPAQDIIMQSKAQKTTSLREEKTCCERCCEGDDSHPMQIASLRFVTKSRSEESPVTDSLNLQRGRLPYRQADMLHDCQLWILCMCAGTAATVPLLFSSAFLFLSLTRRIPLQQLWKSNLRERTQSSQSCPPFRVPLAVKDALGINGNDASDFCK